jgi:propionyl-CoA carboxylase alpha chain
VRQAAAVSGAGAKRPISVLLVTNRGEIARRVFRTCRELGIGTIAVYSDADAGALHVREADAAVRLPGSAAADTYLRADLLVAAALAAGADAVHPGYGFLAESAGFARAVEQAGLVWVGPPAAAVEAMGSKVEAKRLMAAAGVPVLPVLDPAEVAAADLPVLVKASAGGGGRGMRVARTLAELPAAVQAARAEAESAFGDPMVFCEPYLEGGRHLEVQVLADGQGTVWALGERECSIQRRYQKVIEEAPSPAVDVDLRRRLGAAAVAAARAVGYVGAGTVEFLARGGEFSFLEMNTRLQVEHPVTECVTGLDLVALQLHVAQGQSLKSIDLGLYRRESMVSAPGDLGSAPGNLGPRPGGRDPGPVDGGPELEDRGPEPPPVRGHAIEARLYAEDPAAGWRPDSGVLYRFAVPEVDAELAVPDRYGLRLDASVAGGSAVGVHYDPMLAKLVAWAPSREEAARRLAAALAGARLHGLATNRDLLVRVLRHPAFLAGETDTGFLDRHGLAALAEPLADPAAEALSALAAALAGAAANQAGSRVQPRVPAGWRNVPSQPQRRAYLGRSGRLDVAYRLVRGRLEAPDHPDVTLVSATPDEVVLEAAGVTRTFAVARYPGLVCVDSALGPVTLRPVDRFPPPDRAAAAGSLLAPMPGTVVSVAVAEGDAVRAGQQLLVLEAMKMQHPVAAPTAGTVQRLPVRVGSQVEAGALLAVVTSAEP